MSKLNIHRDQPQPSDEQLLKHKNFDAVLKGAQGAPSSGTQATSSFWKNPITWIGGIALITGVIILLNVTSTPDKTLIAESPETKSTDNLQINGADMSDHTKEALVTNDSILDTSEIKDQIIPTNHKEETILNVDSAETRPDELSNPIIKLEAADGPIFKLSEDFGLTENFTEFESYDQVNFQPLEKINPAYLKTAWDSAFLKNTDSGYELILHKNSNEKTFKVKPTL